MMSSYCRQEHIILCKLNITWISHKNYAGMSVSKKFLKLKKKKKKKRGRKEAKLLIPFKIYGIVVHGSVISLFLFTLKVGT